MSSGASNERGQTTLDFAVGIGVFLVVVAFVFAFIPGMIQPFQTAPQEQTAAANRIADTLSRGMLGDPDEPFVLDRDCTAVFFEDDSENPGLSDIGENTDGDGDFSGVTDDSTGNSYPACNFNDDPLRPRVGLSTPGLDVRIRLVRDLSNADPNGDGDPDFDEFADDQPGTLCLDANDPRIIEAGDGDSTGPSDANGGCDVESTVDDDVIFSIGPTPPAGTTSIVTARRVVEVEGGFADGSVDATLIVEVWK